MIGIESQFLRVLSVLSAYGVLVAAVIGLKGGNPLPTATVSWLAACVAIRFRAGEGRRP